SETGAGPRAGGGGGAPRRKNGEGRSHWGTGGHTPRSDASQWSHRGSGDGMPAKRSDATRETLGGGARGPNREPARDRPGRLGWRTGPQYRRGRVMPAEGRGLSSRRTSEGAREPGDWR